MSKVKKILNNLHEVLIHSSSRSYLSRDDILKIVNLLLYEYEMEQYNTDTCSTCKNFIGGGDWDLCCSIKHELCYKNTPKCENYEKI